jgi:metal-responsive CopG/Arc/MetJ family transcriptional regulator
MPDKRIKVDLTDELEAEVRRLAKQYGISMADVIRQAVHYYVTRGEL